MANVAAAAAAAAANRDPAVDRSLRSVFGEWGDQMMSFISRSRMSNKELIARTAVSMLVG